MREFGMCLRFSDEGNKEPRWARNENEMKMQSLDWLALLAIGLSMEKEAWEATAGK